MRSFERTLLGVLALVGSTLAVACAAEPAPEPFANEGAASSKGSKKSTKSNTTADDDDSTGDATPAPATTTSTETTPPAVDPEPTPAPEVVVTPSDTVYTGKLAKTAAAKFGGSPYCEYQTHFENVSVKVVVGPDGNIKSATVTGRAVEQALNNCPNNSIPSNLHDYTLASAVTGATFSVNGGGPSAEPHAKLDATVNASGASGSVTLKIARNDQTAPLVWTVNATVPLTKL